MEALDNKEEAAFWLYIQEKSKGRIRKMKKVIWMDFNIGELEDYVQEMSL